MTMIRRCTESDIDVMYAIINDAAQAYRGIIPDDRWHEPYMPIEELEGEIRDGVEFWGLEEDCELLGVMGIQDRGEVTLMRHAYVRTARRKCGIGTQLLRHLDRYLGIYADQRKQCLPKVRRVQCQRCR
jgi:N-acetylglutamate synthase-like GNAT family acetyltransferase